jgi:hypothetical protein
MPGLLRGIARTAVVAGTATAVSNRVSRRQAGRWSRRSQDEQYEDQQYQDEQYGAPEAARPADDMSAQLAQLKQLGELKAQGVVSDAEFEQQKARILGGS